MLVLEFVLILIGFVLVGWFIVGSWCKLVGNFVFDRGCGVFVWINFWRIVLWYVCCYFCVMYKDNWLLGVDYCFVFIGSVKLKLFVWVFDSVLGLSNGSCYWCWYVFWWIVVGNCLVWWINCWVLRLLLLNDGLDWGYKRVCLCFGVMFGRCVYVYCVIIVDLLCVMLFVGVDCSGLWMCGSNELF